MKRAKNLDEVLTSIQHVFVEQVNGAGLLSENTIRIWKNCTLMAELAQSVADPHGKTQLAHLAARVVGASAECKVELLKLMETPGLSRAEAVRYTRRALKNYSELRTAVQQMGAKTGSCWGSAVHALL